MWLLAAAAAFGGLLGWLARAASGGSPSPAQGAEGGERGDVRAPASTPLDEWLQSAAAALRRAEDAVADAKDAIAPAVSYLLGSFIQWGALAKFGAVFVATLPLILVLGYFYRAAANSPWGASVYRMYALLYGSPVSENSAVANLVANFAFLAGFFCLACVIALVSEEVNMRFESIRSGAFPVVTRDHVLLLGWNSQAVAVLRKIAETQEADLAAGVAQSSWQRPVVVLADHNKQDMDQQIKEGLWGKGYSLNVQTRRGVPFKMSDLETVSAARASTIILMHPDKLERTGSEEAVKAATAMSLVAIRSQASRIVVQHPEEVDGSDNVLASLAAIAGNVRTRISMLNIPEATFLQRLLIHAGAQPGMVTVWRCILSPEASTAQLRTLPLPRSLTGATYATARRSYDTLCVCGYLTPTGKVRLNPLDTEQLERGARLIALVPTSAGANPPPSASAVEAYTAAAAVVQSCVQRSQRRVWSWHARKDSSPVMTVTSKGELARSIIVAGAPAEHIADLQQGFASFTPAGSRVTFIASDPLPRRLPSRLGTCTFRFVHADAPTSLQVLLDAGIATADTIILEGMSGGRGCRVWESDAQVLSSLLQVQEAVQASGCSGRPPHIVAPINKYATGTMATQFLAELNAARQQSQEGSGAGQDGGDNDGAAGEAAPTPVTVEAPVLSAPEFLIPDDLTASLLTQVASEPAYSDLIRELLWVSDGQELYLRRPQAFGVALGASYKFAEIVELGRLSRQSVLGFLTSNGGQCVLAPKAEAEVVFSHGDLLLVVAEEY